MIEIVGNTVVVEQDIERTLHYIMYFLKKLKNNIKIFMGQLLKQQGRSPAITYEFRTS